MNLCGGTVKTTVSMAHNSVEQKEKRLLGIVPLSNNVLGTDILLKPLRTVERLSRHRGVQRQHERHPDRTATESEGASSQSDCSRSPKMLSIPLVSITSSSYPHFVPLPFLSIVYPAIGSLLAYDQHHFCSM